MEWERQTGQDAHVALSGTRDVADALLADPVRAAEADVLDLRGWWITTAGELKGPEGGRQAPGRHTECGFSQSEESCPERNWCLAAGDETYLIYTLEGGVFRPDLSGADGEYRATWSDPRSGQLMQLAHPVAGGR